ncbi:MAG: hypothetical protein QXX57_04690 [Nitrososphaerota archaeon]
MSREYRYVDIITGEVYDKKPEVHDFEGENYVIRIVPEMKLVEVALAVDGDTFREIANLTADWGNVERPSDRIIFRGWKMNGKVNVFVDYEGASFDPRVVIPVTRGTLSRHGYSIDASERGRRSILQKIIEGGREKAVSVYRHLLARATQHKRNPSVAKVLREDAEWVKRVYYGTRWWR